MAPVVYTHVKEPVRFVGTAHVEDLEDLPAPGRRVVGKSPGVLHPHGLAPRGELDGLELDGLDGKDDGKDDDGEAGKDDGCAPVDHEVVGDGAYTMMMGRA